jgi:hypothetical protein
MKLVTFDLSSRVWRQTVKRPLFFPLKTGPLGGKGGTVQVYRIPLVGYTDKTNTTDIQTDDWENSKTIHLEMKEDHKTKEGHDEGVEKPSCQVNKYCEHTSWYMSPESCMWGTKRNISVYITSTYIHMYHIYLHICIYIYTHKHTHILLNTVSIY